MKAEAKVYFFIDPANRDRLRAALPKTRAASIGAFILEAVNFQLESENKKTIDVMACWTREGHEAKDGQKTGRHVVILTFRGAARDTLLEMANEKTTAYNVDWLNDVIESYTSFLENKITASRGEVPRPSMRPNGVWLQ